jgi:hypothetical protein
MVVVMERMVDRNHVLSPLVFASWGKAPLEFAPLVFVRSLVMELPERSDYLQMEG